MERFAPLRAGDGASERDSLVPIAQLELGFRAALRTGSDFGCSGWYTALSLFFPSRSFSSPAPCSFRSGFSQVDIISLLPGQTAGLFLFLLIQ